MKQLLFLAILLGVGYGAWIALSQPIATDMDVVTEAPATSTRPVEKSESAQTTRGELKEISASPKSNSPATNQTSGKWLKHYYDYGTASNLLIMAEKSTALAKKMANKPKKYTYRGNRAPKGWQTEFYNLFLNAPEDEGVLQALVKQFYRQAKEMNVTPVELAIAYVQGGIAYDDAKAQRHEFLLQYPYETIYRREGVCADKTILLSKLLTLMDYKHVLMEFPKAQHMALGLKVPSKYDNFGSGYAFVETTNYTAIGEIPDNYVQGFRINERPNLIHPKQNGKRTFIQMGDYQKKQKQLTKEYGEAFRYGTTRQKQIAIDMKKLEKKLKKLETEHDRRRCAARTRKTDAEMEKCVQLTNDINRIVAEYNALVKQFNAAR